MRAKKNLRGKSKILNIAAQMLVIQISEDPEDQPKTTPKSVLRQIEKYNERLRDWSVELKSAIDQVEDKPQECV